MLSCHCQNQDMCPQRGRKGKWDSLKLKAFVCFINQKRMHTIKTHDEALNLPLSPAKSYNKSLFSNTIFVMQYLLWDGFKKQMAHQLNHSATMRGTHTLISLTRHTTITTQLAIWQIGNRQTDKSTTIQFPQSGAETEAVNLLNVCWVG